ncbi:MAG: hypothetical protein ACLUAR_02645 [Pilosibacter sp.]
MSKSIPELYGSLVFNDSEMKARLPKDTTKHLQRPSTAVPIWNWMSQTL